MSPRAFFLILLGVAVPVIAVGCTVQSDSPNAGPTTVVMSPAVDASVDDASPDVPTGAASKPNIGSPLCNAARWKGCYPDDPSTANAKDCSLAPDGGVDDASGGYGNAQLACRVQRAHGDAGVQPACTPSGSATDGDYCGDPSDCAPGFECVGSGVCRHYCCAGDCASRNEFCDIQPMASDLATKVPVCLPIHSCSLLNQSSTPDLCPTGETCAVVRDNGATSCVAAGKRQAGDECDTGHCARSLVCLGTAGDRRCYTLCHTAPGANDCASTPKQMCKGGLPLFPVPGIGICE
jgi:hypothetical protein